MLHRCNIQSLRACLHFLYYYFPIAVIEVGFEESEYRISEQAANSEYATLEICLKQIDEQVTLVAEPITVMIATQGGTAISKSPRPSYNGH